jgi:hypothetical protein
VTDTPEWVRQACRRWGRQKRRIWSGTDWHGNLDGYAESLLGRIRDEREGAGQGMRAQHWPEVYWGDGLDVQRALIGMPERQFYALHLHYVWDPRWGITAARKASYMGIGRSEYFELVDRAETWVHARLTRPDSQALATTEKIDVSTLQIDEPYAKKAQTGRSVTEIDFGALRRPLLKLRRPA